MKTAMRGHGTSSRVGHDADPYYSRKVNDHVRVINGGKQPEVDCPPEAVNKIFAHSSERMSELPDNCIHLMVTSPPYNVGKDYDEDLSLKEYREMLRSVWSETFRVLAPGGRACVNVANIGRKPYIPLNALITTDMLDIGFLMRGEIIWHKGASAGVSCAWGSWRSASNPVLRDTHEYIMVYCKGDFKRQTKKDKRGKNSIQKTDFLEWTKSVWNFPAESATRVGHPAPYPEELPTRLIHLYTFENDIVLDPFMGSGTTALAAKVLSRNWVGYDISEEYVVMANNRLEVML